MVEGERPPLILRRIQSYWSDWKSLDDYTVHVDGEDQVGGSSGATPRIPRACRGCGRSNFTSAKGAPNHTRGTRPISMPRWRHSADAGRAWLPRQRRATDAPCIAAAWWLPSRGTQASVRPRHPVAPAPGSCFVAMRGGSLLL